MATIGTFTRTENGFTGAVKTLTLNVKARITPSEKSNEKAPDFRIFAGQIVEFGAAWMKMSSEGREYLSVKLDDPSFLAPIHASLVEVEGKEGFRLSGPAATATEPIDGDAAPRQPAGRSRDHLMEGAVGDITALS